jgi:hypothetical protein
MRKIKMICAGVTVCLFVACNSNNDKKAETPQQEVVDTISVAHSADSAKTIINRSMIWSVEPESGEKEKLKAPENAKLDTFSSEHLVKLINENFPDIHLDLIKVSHDTIYVKIPDSKRLTEEIGNTGADNYLASATFTLTELKNIKYVNIALKAGDHAEPGVYSRADFKELR